jgi:hypothetical protein
VTPDAFSGSYAAEDVSFLLKRVSASPTDPLTRERLIQSGERHYSETIPAEQPPDERYMTLYRAALERNSNRFAADIVSLAAAIGARAAAGREIVIVSLVRAGTPVGVLLTRALRRSGRTTAHYSISIVRDRGIDRQALAHIAARHDPADVIFVDGWTGKGAIVAELRASLANDAAGFRPFLAVVADPAGRSDLAATADDYLIPSGLLNGVISGLISRSILRPDLVGPRDFHACIEYTDLAPHDISRSFVDRIDAIAANTQPGQPLGTAGQAARIALCEAMIESLLLQSGITDRNRIKPGIAEATRALLRRMPHRLFLRDPEDPDVHHLVHLAQQRGVGIAPLDQAGSYRAVAVIETLGA